MSSLFRSFFQGGFECSTHRRKDGVRLDVIHATSHDVLAGEDYKLLATLNIRTVRDGLRWHLIEQNPGKYDWSSFLPMLRAARKTNTQIVWDLFHYGWPDWIDIWSAEFIERYAAFAKAVAQLVHDESDDVPFYVPINEISFTAWAGGEFAVFNPGARGRGDSLKRQLVRAAIAGIEGIWNVNPAARIAHIEPAINVLPASGFKESQIKALEYNNSQFAAWDMLSGTLEPELGGSNRYLDILGVNYYCHNQWIEGNGPIDFRDPRAKPLRKILTDNYDRYGRPLFLAETGIEAALRPEWLRFICKEVREAILDGCPVEGICLYPILNHPGWDDDRHCPNGLIDYSPATKDRWLYGPLAEELSVQQACLPMCK
ncbi:MAG TPA: beta-glucosidase [Aestuariivirga sp.]|nr:beta-glucosidase [Aestuariivirga sp.]